MTNYNESNAENKTELKNEWMKKYKEYNQYLIELKKKNETNIPTFEAYCKEHK